MKRLNIIIVAEGAIDRNNKPITTDFIKNVSKVWQVQLFELQLRLYDLYYCTAALVWL